MLSILFDKIFIEGKLIALQENSDALSVDEQTMNPESQSEALEAYIELMDDISKLMETYQELLNHDIEQIREASSAMTMMDVKRALSWNK